MLAAESERFLGADSERTSLKEVASPLSAEK